MCSGSGGGGGDGPYAPGCPGLCSDTASSAPVKRPSRSGSKVKQRGGIVKTEPWM